MNRYEFIKDITEFFNEYLDGNPLNPDQLQELYDQTTRRTHHFKQTDTIRKARLELERRSKQRRLEAEKRQYEMYLKSQITQ